MKKILVTLMSVCMLAIASNAQTNDAAKAAKAAEKEAKAKYKSLQNENIEKALKEVGVSDKEIVSFKEVTQDASSKSNDIKKNTSLTDEQKEEALKANSEEKNVKLRALIGEARYKEFNKIRKGQKVAEEAIIAQYKQ